MNLHAERQARFRCDVCQQGFTRTDHLKRHQLRHTGIKPYSCVFCSDAFARCDSLRNHYADCLQRGNRPIPETDQKGRRRHACELCISMKLRCEGTNPCNSCQKRGTPCLRPNKSPSTPGKSSTASPKPASSQDRIADLSSIKFLLNGGIDGFMESFQFPNKGNCNTAPPKNLIAKSEARSPEEPLQAPVYDNAIQQSFPGEEVDHTKSKPFGGIADFQEAVQNFNYGPFHSYFTQWQETCGSFQPHEALWPITADPSHLVCDYPAVQEEHNAVSAALCEALLATIPRLTQDIEVQHALTADAQFILTPRRISGFLAQYFKLWHPNGPFIHEPSFDPETAQLPLLMALVFMGAMYSVDDRELKAAKNLLDVVELYAFASDVFAPEAEMKRSMDGVSTPNDLETDWITFQHFQGGYLISVIQHWAGSRLSRSRAMECRYSEVIKVARKIGLTKARHMPEDRVHQDLWMQKECRVRTINVIITLDCAFLFFQNYPQRLTLAELDCDLPCEEDIWNAKNPFTEPDFRFTRNLTVKKGLGMLFNDDPPPVEIANTKRATSARQPTFTFFDLFVLIHVITSFASVRITLNLPIRQMTDLVGIAPEDPSMIAAQRALLRWEEHWQELCRVTPPDAWSTMGLYKNGYKYYLVAHFLVTRHDELDAAFLLQPGCEDKLERLQHLA